MSGPTLTFEFPMPRNIGNGGHYHWRTRHNQKLAYIKALDALQAAGKLPAPPREKFARARVDSIMHLANQMDHDNAMRRHKWILDWLQTRGYIVDDSPKHLEWVSFPEQRVKRDGNYRVVLTLWPLDATTPATRSGTRTPRAIRQVAQAEGFTLDTNRDMNPDISRPLKGT